MRESAAGRQPRLRGTKIRGYGGGADALTPVSFTTAYFAADFSPVEGGSPQRSAGEGGGFPPFIILN
jgi:hypothetical protein